MPKVGLSEWLAIGRAIADGEMVRYNNKGQFTKRFEAELGARIGVHHVLTVNSGTNALMAALAAAGIGPGDEVIVPAYTWMATAAAVVMVGAVPILADINDTLTIDPADIKRKISPYTRAIIPVHMLNLPCDMDAIMAVAQKYNLLVIEDACQSVGVRYKDKYLGTIGDAGAFSFNKYKNMNIGEGGAVLTNSDRLFARARNFHDLGADFRGHETRYNEPTFVGSNMRVTEMAGAMLRVQMKKAFRSLERLKRVRKELAEVFANARNGMRVSPHNDAENAVTVTVQFDTQEEASRFAQKPGVIRLLDSSKHVYTNWDPILAQRTYHPAVNPWRWAHRDITYDPDMCKRTLAVLGRSCRVMIGNRAPMFLVRRKAAALMQPAV